MSEAIKKSDVQQGEIFLDIANEIKAATDELKKFDEQLKTTAKTYQNDLAKAEKANAANLQKINALNEQSKKLAKDKEQNVKNLTTLEKEQLKLNQAIAKERARTKLATSEENKELQKLRAEKNKTNKAIRDEIKQVERNKNAYTKLSDESRRLKNESKRLGAEMLALDTSTRKGRKEYKKLEKQYNSVTAAASKTDKQLKRLDERVGDNQRKVGAYKKALQGLTRALGAIGVVTGVSSIARNVGGIVADFDQAQTDLAAISGKTQEELAGLTEQARELGATTQFSATEVTQLQIELAKLGFTTQEITDSTGGIANFAAATGVEIPRAAALAGSALRAFNLEASEIDRVVSTLGVATTKTALDFSKLEAGLSTVAPVAASFGFSIEDTTALLGQLSNAGFDASSSATATRNILLNLADANGALAKELGRPIKSADDLAAGLQELQAKGIDLAKALELTDKRSVAAFSTFIENSGTLVELRDSITDVNDDLKDMADKRLNSVQGALTQLNSKWEAYILGLNESIGASEVFQKSIKFIGDNLDAIVGTLFRVIRAYALYRAATSKLGKATGALVTNLIRGSKAMVTLGKNTIAYKKAIQGAKTAAQSFGKAVKSIGFMLLIDQAASLAVSLYDVASGYAEARRQKDLLDAAEKGAQLNLDKINEKIRKNFEERMRDLDIELRERKLAAQEAGKSDQELADLEKELDSERAERTKEIAELARKENIETEKFKRSALRETERLENLLADVTRARSSGSATQQISALRTLRAELKKIGINISDDWSKVNQTINKVDNKLFQRNERLNKELDGLRESRLELSQQIEEYDVQLRETLVTEGDYGVRIADNTKKTTEAAEAQKNYADATDELNAKLEAQAELEKIRSEFGLDQAAKRIEDQAQLEVDAALRTGKVRTDLIDLLITEEETLLRRRIELRYLDAVDAAENAEQVELAEERRRQALLKLEEDTAQKRKDIIDDLNNAQEEFAAKQIESNKDVVDDTKDSQNELFDIVNSVQRNITNVILEQTDKRIDALRKEVDAQRQLRDQLTALAAEGNIEAQQSIAATIEAERKKEAEILRLEERKQKVQLISQGLETYLNLVEGGTEPSTAFAQTVITTQGLISFLSGLQGFWTGTENAPGGLAWTQEKGAEIITDKKGNIKSLGSDGGAQLTYLQKGDKVKNASETANIFRAFGELDNLRSIPNQDIAGNSYDLMVMGSKLDNIERAIKNQPHSYTDWENITRGMSAINSTTRKGGDVVRNRHIIRR